MAGCFGNHPVDRWMESQLMRYLDECDANECDNDECEEEECLGDDCAHYKMIQQEAQIADRREREAELREERFLNEMGI